MPARLLAASIAFTAIGLADSIVTPFTILLSRDTIDEAVDQRLREKIKALAKLVGRPGAGARATS